MMHHFASFQKRIARIGVRTLSTTAGSRVVASTQQPVAKKPRVVVLGTGWAGFGVVKELPSGYDVTVVSPRNHFTFTPLLASTAVGTLEFRSIVEPVRDTTGPKGMTYHYATASSIDVANRTVCCQTVTPEGIHGHAPGTFSVPYDILIIALGMVPNTFGIPGVAKHCIFLKELQHARAIRQRILSCFELARDPGLTDEDRKKLLHFVVVGGGPTGVEFCAELGDFVSSDVPRYYPHLDPSLVQVSLLEAGENVLTAFDKQLVTRAMKNFEKMGIKVRHRARVENVDDTSITLKGGEVIRMCVLCDRDHNPTCVSYGLCVWSAGVAPQPVIESLQGLEKDSSKRLITDDKLLAKNYDNIFVLGDCGTIENNPLPSTAQVASQQATYVAHLLKKRLKNEDYIAKPWVYNHMGLFAYIGNYSSLVDSEWFKQSGFISWVIWRSAYLTKMGSFKNKLQMPLDWTKTLFWGRDITMF